MRILSLAWIVLVLAAGCSVKEDRDGCPCRLFLDFSNIDTTVVRSLKISAACRGEEIFSEHIKAEDFADIYERDIPKGSLRMNVWAGGEGRLEGDGVVIPYGCECPPVYMKSFIADASGESCHEEVSLNKNHCRVTVLIDGMSVVPYSLTFRGNVDGYGLDGLPSPGEFACVAYPGEEGGSQALLPRQLDSSLLLDVDDGTLSVKTFALGEYIAASGYDWSSEDLKDVTIVLDYYITYMKIVIQGWDRVYEYDIVL